MEREMTRRGLVLLAKVEGLIDGTDGIVTISQLAETMSVDVRSAQRWLRKFERAGVIRSELVPMEGSRCTTLNRLVPCRSAAKSTKAPPPFTYTSLSYPSGVTGKEKTQKEVGGGGAFDDPRQLRRPAAAKHPDGEPKMHNPTLTDEQTAELEAFLDRVENDYRSAPDRYVVPEGVLLPYPSTDVIKLLNSPPMPRLTGIERDDVLLMMRAYRAARDQLQPRKVWGKNLEPDAWAKLSAALPFMRDAGVTEPHSWAMFKIWSLNKSTNPKRPRVPRISGVYNRKAFENKQTLEWYHDKAYDIRAPRSYRLEKHAELVNLWNAAKSAVEDARPTTHDEAVAVARLVLDQRTYDRLVREAEVERSVKLGELRRSIEMGEWVWTSWR